MFFKYLVTYILFTSFTCISLAQPLGSLANSVLDLDKLTENLEPLIIANEESKDLNCREMLNSILVKVNEYFYVDSKIKKSLFYNLRSGIFVMKEDSENTSTKNLVYVGLYDLSEQFTERALDNVSFAYSSYLSKRAKNVLNEYFRKRFNLNAHEDNKFETQDIGKSAWLEYLKYSDASFSTLNTFKNIVSQVSLTSQGLNLLNYQSDNNNSKITRDIVHSDVISDLNIVFENLNLVNSRGSNSDIILFSLFCSKEFSN